MYKVHNHIPNPVFICTRVIGYTEEHSKFLSAAGDLGIIRWSAYSEDPSSNLAETYSLFLPISISI